MSEKDTTATTDARPVVFVDRDKTLIEDPGYISDPDQVVLLSGAAKAVTRLRKAGYPVVVVTNQSGIARGMFTEVELVHIHQRMQDLLRTKGAEIDAIYYCPYLDGLDAKVSAYRRDSDLRKPKPGMLLLAAREMNVDLAASWMVGDSMRDVEAGRAAGCQTVLIGSHEEINGDPPPDYIVPNLGTAADVILGVATDADVVRPHVDEQPEEDSVSETHAEPVGAVGWDVPQPEEPCDSSPMEEPVAGEETPAESVMPSQEAAASEGRAPEAGDEPTASDETDPVAELSHEGTSGAWVSADGGKDVAGNTDTPVGVLQGVGTGTACAVADAAPPATVVCETMTETVKAEVSGPQLDAETPEHLPETASPDAQSEPEESGMVSTEPVASQQDRPSDAATASNEHGGPVLEEVVLTPWDAEPCASKADPDRAEVSEEKEEIAPVEASAGTADHRVDRATSSLRKDLDKSPRAADERIASLLEQLLEETRMVRRSQQHEDFSIGRLAGAIAQAVALCAVGGALYAAVEQTPESGSQVLFRLLAGIAFQLMALTWFVASKEK